MACHEQTPERMELFKMNEKYLLNQSRNQLMCLGGRQRFINSENFMFGQSEVQLSALGTVEVQRKGKFNQLKGNLDDGTWLIRLIRVYSSPPC